ncbi:MAG: rhodanese-like domain-containing protein [Desulfobacterales bacterium]
MKNKHSYILIPALVLSLIIVGCASQKASQKAMTTEEMVAEAKESICEVTVSEAKELLDKGGYLFLDCREPKEYKMGHVPGAVNIPRGLIEFKIPNKVPDKSTHIVMYCKKGGRGCLAACTLCRMGYENVMNMDGGWLAWEKAGYPVE